MSNIKNSVVLFPLGKLVSTPGVLDAVTGGTAELIHFVERHVTGDWSENSTNDQIANKQAIKGNDRIVSKYTLISNETIYIITEWDRSLTTIMLSHEY